MTELLGLFDASLLGSLLRFATPVLLAALGGLLCERAGVFNIGLEGLMLAGAFGAVVGSYFGESAVTGVLAAVLTGVALSTEDDAVGRIAAESRIGKAFDEFGEERFACRLGSVDPDRQRRRFVHGRRELGRFLGPQFAEPTFGKPERKRARMHEMI